MVAMRWKLVSVVVAVIGALAQLEVNPEWFVASEAGAFAKSPEDIFRFCGESGYVTKWFGWISTFREADKQALGLNKKFQASVNVLFFGERSFLLKVTEFVPNRKMVLESDSGAMPRFEVLVEPAVPPPLARPSSRSAPKIDESRGLDPSSTVFDSRLTLRMTFRRKSALFQLFVAPLLTFLGKHQLRRAILMLRIMVP